MEIYSFYEAGRIVLSMFSQEYMVILIGAIVWSLLNFAVVFILQGIGLSCMAKRRNIQKRWLAFVPFANIYFMGKLAGECGFFGHKMKNAGLYAMLAQIFSVLFTCLYIVAECYLYINHGEPQYSVDGMSTPYWPGLTGFSAGVLKFYEYGSFLYSILGLVAELLLLVLVMGLYKKYIPRNYMMMSMLTLFVPVARFITIFAIRNRAPFDYDAYIRARREEYFRRQQQQYGNPYNNPYNNPYGTPHGNPYGNPYAGNAGQPNGQTQQPKPEDPFEEFSSNEKKGNAANNENSDGFFD